MSVHTRDESETVADLLTARGFDRYVVKAPEGIYIANTAASALDLLIGDDNDATLYAADGIGQATKVATWDGSILRYEPRS